MSVTYEIDGILFYEMVSAGAVNLRNNAQTVNELNVFPIPDGDTGENMARTIEGGVAAARGEHNVCDVADSLAKGMLMSARGNSGVILSQFFEGVRHGLEKVSRATVDDVKRMFALGVKQAYSAVVQPTEGTVLTVMREATEKASAIGGDRSIEEYFAAFIDEMYDSLEHTPELLPVLKESGVIDSGGAGFVYIIEGMNSRLVGEHIDATAAHGEIAATSDAASFDEHSEMKFGYCTELIVQLMSAKTDVEKYDVKTLVDRLESIGGDSIVAFKTGTRIKLHVHTFEPDRVMEYCRSIGEFVAVKVENMSIQHTESVVRNRFERKKKSSAKKRAKYACVAVADGAGLIEQFRSLGADYVVDGKQTMNPSTHDFIEAFDAVNAEHIFVLPDNANIIMAAEQAAGLYDKSKIHVIKTKTIAEGYSALSMHDYSSDDVDEITDGFESAVAGVVTGLVTYSIRDCKCGGHDVKTGDWLGFADKTLIADSNELADCACKLLDGIDKSDKSVIIAIRGKGGTQADTDKVCAHLEKTSPNIEFYDFDGGQDVYSFIFVVE